MAKKFDRNLIYLSQTDIQLRLQKAKNLFSSLCSQIIANPAENEQAFLMLSIESGTTRL